MIFRFMDANKADFPIRLMAKRLGVSPSGFYEWRHRQSHPSARTVADVELTETITDIWRQSRGIYGSPRVWAELRLGRDVSVGHVTGRDPEGYGGIAILNSLSDETGLYAAWSRAAASRSCCGGAGGCSCR